MVKVRFRRRSRQIHNARTLNRLIQKIRVCFLFSYFILIAAESVCQSTIRESLWRKLCYINDTLRSASGEELNSLLEIEKSFRRDPAREDSVYAFLLSGVGHLYYEQGDYIKATQYYRRAIDMVKSGIRQPWINPRQLIKFYFRQSEVYDSLNQVSEKMKALDSCILISERLQSVNRFCLAAIYEKIEYYFDVGDFANCISYAKFCEMRAKEYSKKGNGQDYETGMAYASSSLIWNAMSNTNLANYQVADSLLNTMLAETIRKKQVAEQGPVYEQLASVQLQKGDTKRALDYYFRALKIEKETGRDISVKGILNNIGYSIYLQHDKNYERAIHYFRLALNIRNRDITLSDLNSVENLNILANIGNAYAQMGLFDSAFIYFQLGLDQVDPGIRESTLLQGQLEKFVRQKKVNYITSLLIDKADAFVLLYRMKRQPEYLKQAVLVYKSADQVMDRVKKEQTDPQSRLYWRSDSRRLYEHAIEACYLSDKPEDAFYFFEKSRAALLMDQLREQKWLGETEIRKQAELRKKVQQLTLLSDNRDKNSEEYKTVQDELFKTKMELEHADGLIREKDPFYYQSFIGQRLTTLGEIDKELLGNYRGLVEIFSGDSVVYVLTFMKSRHYFAKLNKQVYDSLSQLYMTYLSDEGMINARTDEFKELSRNLYKLIFLKAKVPAGRILISPDGQYFPFESLVTSEPGQPQRYFLEDYAISYIYSANYIMNSFDSRLKLGNPVFLGVAPVNFPVNTQLASLAGSDISLARIKSNFRDASNLEFGQATKGMFMQRFSNYGVVQLYTHAIASERNKEPLLYFSDSALALSELFGEDKPNTRLVVLSACETGKGKLFKGEGIFSFSRGFAALGIPASISNLWSVDDKATYRITELFYKYLSQNIPVDLALQKAKIDILHAAPKTSQLPYYWAAPVLIGKSENLDIGIRSHWLTSVCVILALSFSLWLSFKFQGYT